MDFFETIIPVTAITMSLFTVIVIAVVIVLAGLKKRKLEIEAYKAAIEKGLEVPEFKSMQKSPLSTLKAALIWIAIGVGFGLMMLAEHEYSGMLFFSIPILIGVALIISYVLEKKEHEKEKAEKAALKE